MKTHIYFLLDRTGSMASMASDVVGGFNGFLAGQRADGHDARMTLVQFDSQDPFEVLADASPIHRVRDLTAQTFQPRGMTPLLDATGNLITHADVRAVQRKQLGKKPESIVVVTFTDGEENASTRYSRADIARLVATKQAQGWTFVFLGAGLDAYAESGSVGYAAGSVQAWAPDAKGAKLAFESLAAPMAAHRGRARRGEKIDQADFFAGAKPAEEDRQARGA
jgi:hypothetical protein